MSARLPSAHRFSRDSKLLLASTGIFAVGVYGIYGLLRVLYILRLGHGPEFVGLFSGAAALTFTVMGMPSGVLGGRFGLRKVMLVGGVITVIGMVILPLVEFLPPWAQNAWPITSQIVRAAGWSMFSVNLVPALMASTTARNRTSVYAMSSVLRGFGTFAGTVSGGLLPGLFAGLLGQTIDAPGPYRFGMWVGAALGLLGLLPLSLVGQVRKAASTERAQSGGPFPVLTIALVVAYVYLTRVGWASCRAFGSAYMDSELRLSPSSIGLITGVGQFAAVLTPLLASRLTAHRGDGWVLLATSFGTALGLLPMALIPHWSAVSLGNLSIYAMSGIWMPTLQMFQMDLVEPRWRSLAYGAVVMGMGLSFGSISLAGGYIIAATGYRSVFFIGAALSAAGGALMLGMLKSRIVRRSS